MGRRANRTAVLEVRDGGPGFTDDDLAVAFERGALHQRYQGVRQTGSGLGLALAAGWSAGSAAGSRRATRPRAAPGSPSGCPIAGPDTARTIA